MWNTCWLAKSLSIGYTVFWHPTQVSFIGNWNFYGKKRKLVNWKMNQLLLDLAWVHAQLPHFSEKLQQFTFCNSMLIMVEWVLVGNEWGRGYGRPTGLLWLDRQPRFCPSEFHSWSMTSWAMVEKGQWKYWNSVITLSQFPKSCLIYFCNLHFSW